MTRDELLLLMATSVREHLSIADAATVGRALLAEPKRMLAYINAHPGRSWLPREFAAYMLVCAKRVLAGGES